VRFSRRYARGAAALGIQACLCLARHFGGVPHLKPCLYFYHACPYSLHFCHFCLDVGSATRQNGGFSQFSARYGGNLYSMSLNAVSRVWRTWLSLLFGATTSSLFRSPPSTPALLLLDDDGTFSVRDVW
jgi:hypothetical protein